MKFKKTTIIIAAAVCICIIAAVIAVTNSLSSNAKDSLDKTFCDLITRAEISQTSLGISNPVSEPGEHTLDNMKISQDGINNKIDEYNAELDSIYSSNSALKSKYADLKKTYLEGANQELDAFSKSISDVSQNPDQFSTCYLDIDTGVFKVKILSKSVDDDTATLKVRVISWMKAIKTLPDGTYDVYFPVNKDTNQYKFVKENDQWKIEDFKISDKEMAGDNKHEKAFGTFDEAYEYAVNTAPSNVYIF